MTLVILLLYGSVFFVLGFVAAIVLVVHSVERHKREVDDEYLRMRSGKYGIYLEPVGGHDTDPFAKQDVPAGDKGEEAR